MLKVIVTQVHRWVGVPLGVLFLVTLVTGLVVGGADLLRALDGKGQTHRETSIEEDARALEQMTQDVPQIFQAVMPTPRTPFYQARARGETRTYRIGDLELIDHQVSSGFYRLALGLHRTFLLGRHGGVLGISGADIVAWIGLIATVFSLLPGSAPPCIWSCPLRNCFAVSRVVLANFFLPRRNAPPVGAFALAIGSRSLWFGVNDLACNSTTAWASLLLALASVRATETNWMRLSAPSSTGRE